jgi:hypothetical protein
MDMIGGKRDARWPAGLGVASLIVCLVAAAPAIRAAAADRRGSAAPPITTNTAAGQTLTPNGASNLPSLRAADQVARDHVRYAIDLAERGAVCSAHAELVGALNSVALSLDAQQPSPMHSAALKAGLQAMREADDFAPQGVSAESQVNLARVIAVHRTPVLKTVDVSHLTQMDALESYYAYAAENLARAGGRERAASMALHGCGRMELVAPALCLPGNALATPRAIAWQRAALLVDPGNYLAANELGVLLARCQQWREAKQWLVQSVRLAPTAEGWRNLSAVHAKLGETTESQRAHQAYLALVGNVRASAQATGGASAAAGMRWVEPAVFVHESGPDQLGAAVPSPLPPKQSPATASPAPSPKDPLRQLSSWLGSK